MLIYWLFSLAISNSPTFTSFYFMALFKSDFADPDSEL